MFTSFSDDYGWGYINQGCFTFYKLNWQRRIESEGLLGSESAKMTQWSLSKAITTGNSQNQGFISLY